MEGGYIFTLSPFTGEKFAMMGSTSNNTNVKEDDQALAQLAREAGVLKQGVLCRTNPRSVLLV